MPADKVGGVFSRPHVVVRVAHGDMHAPVLLRYGLDGAGVPRSGLGAAFGGPHPRVLRVGLVRRCDPEEHLDAGGAFRVRDVCEREVVAVLCGEGADAGVDFAGVFGEGLVDAAR